MSYNAGNVPLIAITTEENAYGEQEESSFNIEETLTDTEELYISTEQKKKKKTKKPAPKPDLYATDIEDFEGSDNEISVSLVKHEAPIDITDVINASSPNYEEVSNDNVKGGQEDKKKLRTQTSVISCGRYLDADEAESSQILTDTEDFDKSDDEGNVSETEENDNEILQALMNDSETIAISDRSKKSLTGTPSPSVTPVPGLSDHEWLECSKVSKRAFSLGSARLTTPNTGDAANDVTDTEMLLYDSDGQVYGKKQRAKVVKTRKRASANKPTSNLTDSDDVDASDSDQKIINRLALTGHSSKSTGATTRKSIYRPCTPTNCFAPMGTFGNEPESEDDSMFPGDKKAKPKKVSTLKVNTDVNEAVTDTEDLDFEYTVENEIPSDIDVPYYAEGIDSSNGVIEEKLSSKEKFRVCNVETSVVHKNKKSSSGQDQNDTDEEVCEGDVTPEWTVKDPAEFTINLNFVSKNNSRSLKGKQKSTKISTNLLVPNAGGEEGALTEVEDLDSADEGRGGPEIPMTVINKGTYDDQTDTESVEGEIDPSPVTNVPDSYLPLSVRKIVIEKLNKDNTYEVIVTKDNNEEEDLDEGPSGIKYELTDVEEFSGDDDMLDDISKSADINFDITAPDEGVVQQADKLKVPDPCVNYEEETDTEEITGVSGKKLQKHYLQAHRKSTGKLTDTEDFEISDAENLDDGVITLQVSTIADDAANGKTDIEDFVTSDNENTEGGPIEPPVTPDILHEMEGETICTKEGMGKFTKQDRKKLNKINLSQKCATPVSPTHTDTDDCIASADDESYSRAETATPLQMHQALDEAGNFRIHSQNLKKADLEAEDEVMYLKGGGYMLDVFTDVEEMGISDEEHMEKNNGLHKSAEPNVSVHFKKNENQVFLSYADKEWSSSEAQPAVEQPASRQTTLDAAQSESSQSTQAATSTAAGEKPSSGDSTEGRDDTASASSQQRGVADQHQLSAEMKDLLAEMEKQSKQ